MDIKCAKCGVTIHHKCKSDVTEAVERLYTWAPERTLGDKEFHKAFLDHGRRSGYLEDGADPSKDVPTLPFFGSQAWSYPLFGNKEDARSFHGVIDQLVRAVGLDPHEIRNRIVLRIEAEQDEYARLRARRLAVTGFKALTETQQICIAEGKLTAEEMFPDDDAAFHDDIRDLARLYVERKTRSKDRE